MKPPMKLAVVVDSSLPSGLAANTAAVLTLTVGHRVPELVGPDLKDADGCTHLGITTTPIPILTASTEHLKAICGLAREDLHDLLVVGFSDCAQRTRTYDDYAEALESSSSEELTYLGAALYGPRKKVVSLTGTLRLLR
ncbi:DUF2000 domain-containing protein [Monashia sp. NPDC004114]